MINIQKFLKENSDLHYADFNRKFIKSKYPILGVRLPALRKFAKEIEPEYIELGNNLCMEEILLYAFAASNIKNEAEQLEYLQNLLPLIDNWCTCDCTVQSLKKLTGKASFKFFMKLLESEKEFEIRVGIVGLMRYFISSENLPDILSKLREISNHNYYVQMGLAWFYAELCINHFTLAKAEISKLQDNFVKNKAICKARESFRVSKEHKEELLALRNNKKETF